MRAIRIRKIGWVVTVVAFVISATWFAIFPSPDAGGTVISSVLAIVAMAVSTTTVSSKQDLSRIRRITLFNLSSGRTTEQTGENSLVKQKLTAFSPSSEALEILLDDSTPANTGIYDLSYNILDTYHKARNRLLVVGKSGSGKSTQLNKLFETLLNNAVNDESAPIPILLPLSTWGTKHSDFKVWLTNEISSYFNITSTQSTALLAEGHIVLLLDGLDEVNPTKIGNCVRELNAYLAKYTPSGIVVACRESELIALPDSPDVNQWVYVCDLERDDIVTFLEHIGRDGDHTLHGNFDIRLEQNFESPLALTLLLNARSQELIYSAKTQSQVIERYISDAIAQRPTKLFSDTDVERYLSWVAKYMFERNRSILQIEDIQPDSLSDVHFKQYAILYRVTSTVVGFTVAILPALIFQPFATFDLNVAFGLIHGLGSATYSWIFSGESWSDKRLMAIPAVLTGLAYGIQLVLLDRLYVVAVLATIFAGAISYIDVGIFGVQGFQRLASNLRNIVTLDTVGFRFQGLPWIVIALGIVTSAAAAIFALHPLLTSDRITIDQALPAVGTIGTIYLCKLVYENGLVPYMLRSTVRPNEGMRTTFSVAVINFMASFTTWTLIIGLGGAFFTSLDRSLALALTLAFPDAYLTAVLAGGNNILQHGALRVVLAGNRILPLNIARFLRHTGRIRLTTRVGGGYRFFHRHILMNFADKYDANTTWNS